MSTKVQNFYPVRLTPHQFDAWCRDLGLSVEARAHVERIRSSPPARRVTGRVGNFVGRYPSRKMGVSIQFESRTAELPTIFTLEHDPEVLEYYDQPPEIKLQYAHSNGRPVAFNSVQDFFVIGKTKGEYLQVKPEAKLLEGAKEAPNRYRQDGDGRWRCPPGEAFAAQYGLRFRVVSSTEMDVVWQRNITFLEDYFRPETPEPASDTITRIVSWVTAQPGIALEDLRHLARDVASVDEINRLLAADYLFVDLYEAPLTDASRVRVFPDQLTASLHPAATSDDRAGFELARSIEERPGACVEWDNRPLRIVHVGGTTITLVNEDDTPIELRLEHWNALIRRGQIKALSDAVPKDTSEILREVSQSSATRLHAANLRADILRKTDSAHATSGTPVTGLQLTASQTHLAGHILSPPSERTVRRWRKKYRDAEILHGHGYLGLLDGKQRRGNRMRKISEAIRQLMEQRIELDYENIINRRRIHVHAQFVLECQKLGLDAPSLKTFNAAVKARSGPAQTLSREGKRAAYQVQPFHWWLEPDTPRHGERPFEVCYLDHYEFPIKLRCPHTDKVLGKPWGSVLVDGNTRRILATHVSYEEPSYRSCQMALRLCVLNFGRLPQTLIVDNGSDFRSVYFEALCACYGVTIMIRPPGQPRGGSVIERLFRTTETRFVHELIGNTQLDKNARQLTKAVSAETHATWTLTQFFKRLCQFAHEQQDTIEHPALGQSPREAFNKGLMLHGERAHTRVAYDAVFKLMTMPSTPKGKAKVDRQKGVRINHFEYWSPAFTNPQVAGRQVPVRYDPWNIATAHALIENRWVECSSNHNRMLQGRTEKELRHAAAELRRRASLQGRQASLTALQLARFMAEVRDEETALLRDREAANKEVMTLAEQGLEKLSCVAENTQQPRAALLSLPIEPDSPRRPDEPWRATVKPEDLPPLETF